MNVVVLGAYRGGTSMVAGVVRKLGIFMGERFDTESGGTNHEDLDFQLASHFVIRFLIERRNEAHEHWGWKDPASIMNIKKWHDALKDPKIIFIFRDVFAIAESEKNRNGSDFNKALNFATNQQKLLADYFKDCPLPKIGLSYERSILDKTGCVVKIANFLNVSPNEEAVGIIKEGGYTKS